MEFNSFGAAVGRLGSDSSRGAKLRQIRSRGAEPPLAPLTLTTESEVSRRRLGPRPTLANSDSSSLAFARPINTGSTRLPLPRPTTTTTNLRPIVRPFAAEWGRNAALNSSARARRARYATTAKRAY